MTQEPIRILVVDDEVSIVQFIKMGLEAEGYVVDTAFDGNQALQMAEALDPDLVILDVMLPGLNGFDVCALLKNRRDIPVIMLTARDEIDDRVKGLNLGADDYMVKPFSFKELTARIKARLRNRFSTTEIATIGAFTVDDGAHEITYQGKRLELSLTEYNLLGYLLVNNGLVLSKQAILEKVWGYDFEGEENIVEVYIRYLRNKINDDSFQIIRTVRGVGYKIIP